MDSLKQIDDKLQAAENEISSASSSSFSKPSQPTEAPRFDKPVPGSTLRCLEDPDFDTRDINSPPMTRSVIQNPVNDELEKARDRFDRFWNPNDGEQK